MFRHADLTGPEDLFAERNQRRDAIAYYYRVTAYSPETALFLERYCRAARSCGLITDSPLDNPNPSNLEYYQEIMGSAFELDAGFLNRSLRKWMPRVEEGRLRALAEAMLDILTELKNAGKNNNVLRNVYVKFMCWLYYRFEQLVNRQYGERIPKLLMCGRVSAHGLLMLELLSRTGCDVLLLVTEGEAEYRRSDPQGTLCRLFPVNNPTPFPPGYGLKTLRQKLRAEEERQRLYEPLPQRTGCVNAWMQDGNVLHALLTPPEKRGTEPGRYYTCFARLVGVEDKLSYQRELYELQRDIKKAGRKLLILSGEIPAPTYDEIALIRRTGAQSLEQIAAELSANLSFPGEPELQSLMRKSFLDLLFEEGRKENLRLTVLFNRATKLLCLIRRYRKQLFEGLRYPQLACFLYLGGCKTEEEALFCRFLSRLPVDVLILTPDLSKACCLRDPLLLEIKQPNSLALERFPEDENGLRLATTAYNAERDLDSLMYGDGSLFRNQQYSRAKTIVLQTTYEEIAVLWDQELKYRPNFGVDEETVRLPVIFAKASGVKDGAVQPYWDGIRALLTPETLLIRSVPRVTRQTENPIKAVAHTFLRNGRVNKHEIKKSKHYPYGLLREPMQEYMLDKLALLVESGLIRGTFENGTEYTIVSTVLNLEKDVMRMIQRFDFTKKNPKLIYLVPGEQILSQEDAICAAFLNLLGFDILIFAPTGYQCVEQYYTKPLVEEHQLGEYLYDLETPELSPAPVKKQSFFQKLFS